MVEFPSDLDFWKILRIHWVMLVGVIGCHGNRVLAAVVSNTYVCEDVCGCVVVYWLSACVCVCACVCAGVCAGFCAGVVQVCVRGMRKDEGERRECERGGIMWMKEVHYHRTRAFGDEGERQTCATRNCSLQLMHCRVTYA